MGAFWPADRRTWCAPIRGGHSLSRRRDGVGRCWTCETSAAFYGPAQVLFDITFQVDAGEVVTLLGRNGMGKTTTISTVMGLLAARGGSATFDGPSLNGLPSYRIAQAGSRIRAGRPADFSDALRRGKPRRYRGGALWSARWTLDRVYGFFPRLAERRRHMGNQLSGGEQQMLAIGRALMTNPKLLILDEATEGLAPTSPAAKCGSALRDSRPMGRRSCWSTSISTRCKKLADRHVVIEKGHVVWTGTTAALAADASVRQRYLQV